MRADSIITQLIQGPPEANCMRSVTPGAAGAQAGARRAEEASVGMRVRIALIWTLYV